MPSKRKHKMVKTVKPINTETKEPSSYDPIVAKNIQTNREFRELMVLNFYRINRAIELEYKVTEDMNLLEWGDARYFALSTQGRARFLNQVMWHSKEYPKTKHFARLIGTFIIKDISVQIKEYLRRDEMLLELYRALEDHAREFRAFRQMRGFAK